MKKDCASTRKSLRKYLRGHLFKYEQVRIARHLNICPVCRSEFQSLKKVADTKQLLKDITPPEGLGQRMKATVSGMRRLKVLLYRPLWMGAIISTVVLVYVNIIAPQQRDMEIENIEKSLPPAASVASLATSTAPAPGASVPPAPLQQAALQPESNPAPTPPADPLLVTITPVSEHAVGRINEIMRGHVKFRKMNFSDTVREISGNLTARELLTFFKRIEHSGKAAYSRKRFASFPATQPIPFVIKMAAPPKPEPASPPEKITGAVPASAPTGSSL